MESTAPTSASVAGPRLRVLAIDDEEQFRNAIKELLEPLGFEVKTTGDPVKALELFTHGQGNYDVVLLDYFMPRMDGAKAFEWLRKLNPKIKVILCSGADELRLRQLQTQHKVDGCIRKPFRTQELVQLVCKVTGRPLPPAR
jgi:two-component system, cell cycle sensor histidine kinase and response regulator CckA